MKALKQADKGGERKGEPGSHDILMCQSNSNNCDVMTFRGSFRTKRSFATCSLVLETELAQSNIVHFSLDSFLGSIYICLYTVDYLSQS